MAVVLELDVGTKTTTKNTVMAAAVVVVVEVEHAQVIIVCDN